MAFHCCCISIKENIKNSTRMPFQIEIIFKKILEVKWKVSFVDIILCWESHSAVRVEFEMVRLLQCYIQLNPSLYFYHIVFWKNLFSNYYLYFETSTLLLPIYWTLILVYYSWNSCQNLNLMYYYYPHLIYRRYTEL